MASGYQLLLGGQPADADLMTLMVSLDVDESMDLPGAVRLEVPQGERQRHRRKYAEGTLGPDKSFYFTGPEHRLNLRAQNLAMFTQIADGIDDDTWLHHLRRGDYSRWVRDAIKDDEMAEEVAVIERGVHMSVAATRTAVIDAINRRYASSAT